MTAPKPFKQLVRSRMEKTGETYAAARRRVLRQAAPSKPSRDNPWHFPGSVPATTALRVLLNHAGVRDPHTGQPFSEAMLFGIAGGVGIGVFSFFYEKEGFASFFIAGRHLWHDHTAYLRGACARFGLEPVVRETAGAKAAATALRAALAEHGPCIAWVDATQLPHRAYPAEASGSGYHVVTVYGIDEAAGAASIGDLTDQPLAIALADLAVARVRIKKDKHRLMSIPAAKEGPHDLPVLVREGLRACYDGLAGAGGVKGAATNFSLQAVRLWAERLHGSQDKERWERVFARGPQLWQGLLGVHEYIECYGGGGLCRPLFAEFLTEAAAACGDARLGDLAARYGELGRGWSALADAALPNEVGVFREVKELFARKSELINSGGSADEVRTVYARLGELRPKTPDDFPLTEAECADLRAGLQDRVRALYASEEAARNLLGSAIG